MKNNEGKIKMLIKKSEGNEPERRRMLNEEIFQNPWRDFEMSICSASAFFASAFFARFNDLTNQHPTFAQKETGVSGPKLVKKPVKEPISPFYHSGIYRYKRQKTKTTVCINISIWPANFNGNEMKQFGWIKFVSNVQNRVLFFLEIIYIGLRLLIL